MAPDRDTWRRLMRPALRLIDSLEAAGYGRLDFRLGGGTVLMLQFDHRLSKDIDIFLDDVQALGFLSPRLSDAAAAVTDAYTEQPNALKLQLPDGDIDFILAAPVIREAPSGHTVVDGRRIVTDSTAEILAKKLFYRSEMFKARDVFDMAAALALDRASALAALRATATVRPNLIRRLDEMENLPQGTLMEYILPTTSGAAFAPGMIAQLRQAIAEVYEV